MNIDYLLSFVDPSKENWVKKYMQYANINIDDKESKRRFSKNDSIKYVFRGIEKYMPWINQVFMVVQDEDQIPEFIDTKTVNIVFHREFIPEKYLPTFNSNTIEMFLHKIPNMSNLFIYGNDDTYILNSCSESDFFIGNFPRNNFSSYKNSGDFYSRKMMHTNDVIERKINPFYQPTRRDVYFRPFHVQQPYSKVLNSKIFDIFKEEIEASISRFRDVNSLSQVLYALYYTKITNFKYINNDISFKYFNSEINIKQVLQYLEHPTHKLVCLNDGDETDYNEISRSLEKIFPKKSKYEV